MLIRRKRVQNIFSRGFFRKLKGQFDGTWVIQRVVWILCWVCGVDYQYLIGCMCTSSFDRTWFIHPNDLFILSTLSELLIADNILSNLDGWMNEWTQFMLLSALFHSLWELTVFFFAIGTRNCLAQSKEMMKSWLQCRSGAFQQFQDIRGNQARLIRHHGSIQMTSSWIWVHCAGKIDVELIDPLDNDTRW